MHICECDWRYPEDYDECPRCGADAPEDNRITQWNSTIKVDPSNRLSRSSPPKSKSSNDDLKKSMEQVGRDHLKENNGKAFCENCGMRLPELRYSNISHIKKRSTHPELRTKVENMEVLCSGENFWGKKDESCHSAWEANDFERFKELEDSRIGERGT